MRKHRGILTIVALLAMGGLSLGVGLQLFWHDRLPDPEEADGDGLMRWLATRELSEESPDIRQKLVRRLERFLDEQDPAQPFELSEVLDQLDDDQTEQFWSNLYLLTELWFLEQVEQYDQLSQEKRPGFLAATIDRVTAWGVMESIPITGTQNPDADTSFAMQAAMILQGIQPWINAREADERRKIEQFLGDAKAYFFLQQLRQLLGK